MADIFSFRCGACRSPAIVVREVCGPRLRELFCPTCGSLSAMLVEVGGLALCQGAECLRVNDLGPVMGAALAAAVLAMSKE